MSDIPFILSKRNDSPFFYVRFKNESTGEYLSAKSTKQTDKRQAEKTAWEWFKNGTIGIKKKHSLESYDIIKQLKNVSDEDLKFIFKELERMGKVKAVVFPNEKNSVSASDFLSDFWDWDKSKYVAEKKRKNHTIGRRHCEKEAGYVRNYWAEFLKEKTLGELKKSDIEEFVDMVAELDKSFCAKNDIIRAGTTAFKWAHGKGLIEEDLFSNIVFFSGRNNERMILTPEQVEAVFSVEWNDGRAKLANMLAMCTGLRAGEIQALRLQDLGIDRLYIRHSWGLKEGLKSTKNGEKRTVLLPFPQIVNELKELAESNPYNEGMNSFVFWATIPNKPMEAKIWLCELREALKKIGVKDAENYTFHAWRHFFSTYMFGKVNQKTLQRQTGHKTEAMLEHYADHATNEEIELLKSAQIKTFGSYMNNAGGFDFDYQKMNKYIRIDFKGAENG